MEVLDTMVNSETAQKRSGYLPRYTSVLPMAYIPGINEKGELVSTLIKDKHENPDDIKDETLEEIVRSVGGSAGEAYDTVQSKYALQKVQDMDKEFVDSGRYDRLVYWCSKNGLKSPGKPKYYGASNQDENAVAWTAPEEGILGVNTYIDDKIHQMAQGSGLTEEQTKELVMTHEYMHNSQDTARFGNNVYMVESDNELNLARYFYDTAISAEDKETREKYIDMSKVCLGRYMGIMASYLKQQGIEVNEENMEQIFEESGFADYAKNSQPNQEQQPEESELEEAAKAA